LLQGLEAEKNLLAAAEARAAGEAAEHFRERCRLSAELEAAHKIHTAKCGVLVDVTPDLHIQAPCKIRQVLLPDISAELGDSMLVGIVSVGSRRLVLQLGCV
jgi:hypothetical protein